MMMPMDDHQDNFVALITKLEKVGVQGPKAKRIIIIFFLNFNISHQKSCLSTAIFS